MDLIPSALKDVLDNRKTYTVGLLQNTAYRILKQETADALEGSGISPTEWALLGVLRGASGVMRLSVLARELDIEAPFVTTMAKKLENKGCISVHVEAGDRRAKNVMLIDSGKKFVDATEKVLRKGLQPLIADAGAKDIIGYLRVLSSIVKNGSDSKGSINGKDDWKTYDMQV